MYNVRSRILSLAGHTATFLNTPQLLGPYTWLLHVGVFVVGFRHSVATHSCMPGPVRRTNFMWTAFTGAPGQALRMFARGFSGHWMFFCSAGAAVFSFAFQACSTHIETR